MIYPTWINKLSGYLFMIGSFVICAQSEVSRPRGVSLSKAALYSPTKDFTCFDGTITIPFSYVNDDYCDCFDGSDEPGTAACLNGVFHCTNAGHRPQNIPSSRVNDEVCDCCDGTDEYATRTICPDTCQELGREARAEALRLAELHKAGSQFRLELIEKGNKKRNEMAEQLSQLEKDKSEAEKIRAEKEDLKNEWEAKENVVLKVYREAEEQEKQRKAEEENQKNLEEAKEAFKDIDKNKDGRLSIGEIKVSNIFDRDKNGEVDTEEAKHFMGEYRFLNEEHFISITWPLLKPLLMMKRGMFQPPSEVEYGADVDTNVDTDEGTRDHDTGDLENDDNADDTEEHDVEQDQSRVYDEETQKVVDEATQARRQLTDAERTIREIEANILNIQQNLEKDYGLHQEFATLEGDCFEYEDKEYIYKLCMFQKVTQRSKDGGAEIGLGNWGEWAGSDNNIYSGMKYTNGVACWNGPNRQTTVNIHCGLETKVLSVSEPFRCEYNIELSTPAACDDSNAQQHQASHDEL